MALIGSLTTYKVHHWGASSDDPSTVDREPRPLDESHVVSSRFKNGELVRHALVIDIDHPAWLVKSSTPDHFHLYVDVAGGIPHEQYIGLLNALADAGVIEQGYAGASRARGHSDVRLPWIKKGQSNGQG